MSEIKGDKKKDMSSENKRKSDFEDGREKFLSAFNTLKDNENSRQQAYREKHIEVIKDSRFRTEFYKLVLQLDTWLLHSEAIPFLFCSRPNQWQDIRSLYSRQSSNLETMVKASEGVGILPVNLTAKPKELRVKPQEFIAWAHNKNLLPYPELADAIDLKNKVDKKPIYSNHKNAEHNAQKRQKVLEAALAILAAYPDQCVYRNRISGTAIYKVMIDKSQIWFDYEELPFSEDVIVDLLNSALKTLELED